MNLSSLKKVNIVVQELPEYQAQLAQEALQSVASKAAKASSRIFSQYDVVETSYHFMSNQIILHLCDDPGGMLCHLKPKNLVQT